MLLVVTDIDMYYKQAMPFSTRAQLFKASLLRGQLKCYKPKYTDIFVEKIREAFAMQKLLTFFQQKILTYFRYNCLKF